LDGEGWVERKRKREREDARHSLAVLVEQRRRNAAYGRANALTLSPRRTPLPPARALSFPPPLAFSPPTTMSAGNIFVTGGIGYIGA
jgi:hypothetical protein